MLDHLVVGIVDLDPPLFVFILCPLELGRFAAADCDDAGARYAVEEGADMAFAHSAQARYGDVDLDVLLGGHLEGLEFVSDMV